LRRDFQAAFPRRPDRLCIFKASTTPKGIAHSADFLKIDYEGFDAPGTPTISLPDFGVLHGEGLTPGSSSGLHTGTAYTLEGSVARPGVAGPERLSHIPPP